MADFRPLDLTDDEWGDIPILVVVPKRGSPWGILEPIRETPWADAIAVVSGEAMSHAFHGWATPLMREIGPKPIQRAKKVPELTGRCALLSGCLGAGPSCIPEEHTPDCYEPPELEGEVAQAIIRVVMAWKSSRYVIVVEGDEFSL